MPNAGANQNGKVRERAKGPDGQVHGKANPNAMLDTRTHIVEFSDAQEAALKWLKC